MAETLGIEVAAHVINEVIVAPLIQQIDDVIHLDRNRGILQAQLKRMKFLLQTISNGFQNQQRTVPEVIQYRLECTRDAIGEARSLIQRSQLQQQCLDCILSAWDCLFCKPSISTQIKDWTTEMDKLFEGLESDISIFVTVQTMVLSAPEEGKDFLQPVPEGGFAGSGIIAAATELQRLLTEAPEVRVISVYGMPGVGKTSLLQTLYNSHKVSESPFFTDVIWVTVSQKYTISDLQDQIAEVINLQNFSSIANNDTRKMKLCASLKNKKFLLILDDVWSSLDLEQDLGVGFGVDKGSKVVFSTRFRDLTLMMEQQSIQVEPLLLEEGQALFERLAFRGGHVPEDLMDYVRKAADECKGLPLAVTVVAAAMRDKTTVDEWNVSLSLMKIADPFFPNTHPRVDKDLYQKLRWSYKELHQTPNLQHCFLYCAMYPEDKKIDVDTLVRMWIAEGFVRSKNETYSMDVDLRCYYVKLLIDRGLFQNVSFENRISKGNAKKPVNVWKGRYVTVHDVIRDMAIYIGERENFLCRAGQQLTDFPRIQTQNWKRISLLGNQIENLPKDFICPKLVSLFLSENPCSVLDNFLIKLNSLRVLDLSHTQIKSLPPCLTQLTSLEFLTLSSTNIKELPTAICSLFKLQFLDLSHTQIESLPPSFSQLTSLEFLSLSSTNIEELPTAVCNLFRLQFLDLSDCRELRSLPAEMSQLTSLKRLHLGMGMEKTLDDPTNVMALKGLKNLIELRLFLFSKFDALATIMGTWLEMRHLYLHHINVNYVKYNLPDEMQKMKNLHSLVLVDYIGIHLPNWICEFQLLERLELDGSDSVLELPALEKLSKLKFLKLRNYRNLKDFGLGSSGISFGFPMLELLHLFNMSKLRSMADEGVLKQGTLQNLRVLKIQKCSVLRKLPRGLENSVNLVIYGHKSWWEKIIWEDNNMKMHLRESFKEI